ncbi:MAG: prephenate dehydrogenase/arogenate dehydrogenase family protein [Trueperaceae bacterium]|nr:prephenate dehydrogenase/arogenate dehydrogenase family protein [Trueperaceae bacterium]
MRPAAILNTVVIAGVGLIGGSIGLGIRQRFLAHRVIGIDPDPGSLDAARGLGIIDEAQLRPGPWLGEADLVILASPARTLIESARGLEPYLSPHAILTDVGSVKSDIVRDLAHLRFVGGHPMAGSERGGVLNADAALLENAVWVLTPNDDTDKGALATVTRFVEHLGARPITTDPDQHDRLVAAISHVPYLTSVALTELVAEDRDRDLMMLLAAGGFRDLTRVASGSPRMSRDMVVGNRRAVRETLEKLREQLERIETLLESPEEMFELSEHAKRSRDSIPIVKRSLLPARFEVVIAVPDKPGQLARITQAMGDAYVNIKDIEVLSIRESGGAVRLAFDSEAQLRDATKALTALGYEVRGRT